MALGEEEMLLHFIIDEKKNFFGHLQISHSLLSF